MRPWILILCAGLTGCIAVVDRKNVETEVDDLTLYEPVGSLYVETGAGNVDVRVGDVDGVQIRRIIQYSGDDRPDVDHALQGDTLSLWARCDGGLFKICQVDHEILLPRSADTFVTTGSGDVRVLELAGDVEVETGSGDVRVALVGRDQVVNIDTGSGDVVLSGDLAWTEVDTGSGDVALTLSAPADLVRVDTGSGDVDVDVPSGPYNVDTRTSSGNVHVLNLRVELDSPYRIDVETGSGDIGVIGF